LDFEEREMKKHLMLTPLVHKARAAAGRRKVGGCDERPNRIWILRRGK
jgi:hypothetical protein